MGTCLTQVEPRDACGVTTVSALVCECCTDNPARNNTPSSPDTGTGSNDKYNTHLLHCGIKQ